MEKVISETETIWYDPNLLSQVAEGDVAKVFEPEYWKSRNAITGSAQGRGTTWFVQLDKLQGALRHYRRGGLFGKLIADKYRFNGWDNTRCAMEMQVLTLLVDAKVNVPRPIAARAVKQGLFYQADLLSERIEGAKDLVDILITARLSDDLYRKVGREIRKMHDVGINHTDLNIHNILIDSNDKVWIIDFDKCAQHPGEGWKQGNLSRLKRSFHKELNKRHIHWQERDWDSLMDGYQC